MVDGDPIINGSNPPRYSEGASIVGHEHRKSFMQLIDSQLHVWGANSAQRPWPPGRDKDAQRPYPVSAESLLLQMDLAGVARAVLVPPSWEGDRNDLALDAAQRYPDRFAVMGRFPLQDAPAEAPVAKWKSQQGMLGMRFTFHNEHYLHFLVNGTADWLWAAAEHHAIPVMIFAPGSMQWVARIAQRHEKLKIVLDHSGLGVHDKAPQVLRDLPSVLGLAKFPNIAVKASGLPALSAQNYPFRDLHDSVRQLFEAFGPQRTFWGTDLTRMPCSYRECIDMFTQSLPWLKGDDLAWVMGRGLCEWLGWAE